MAEPGTVVQSGVVAVLLDVVVEVLRCVAQKMKGGEQ